MRVPTVPNPQVKDLIRWCRERSPDGAFHVREDLVEIKVGPTGAATVGQKIEAQQQAYSVA
jgi:hypothetical protein